MKIRSKIIKKKFGSFQGFQGEGILSTSWSSRAWVCWQCPRSHLLQLGLGEPLALGPGCKAQSLFPNGWLRAQAALLGMCQLRAGKTDLHVSGSTGCIVLPLLFFWSFNPIFFLRVQFCRAEVQSHVVVGLMLASSCRGWRWGSAQQGQQPRCAECALSAACPCPEPGEMWGLAAGS